MESRQHTGTFNRILTRNASLPEKISNATGNKTKSDKRQGEDDP